MYDDELPEFDTRATYKATPLMHSVLGESFLKLEIFDDGHIRIFFKPSYFEIQEGQDKPTKSQWSTLKKRIKRRNKQVFIFKDHGYTTLGENTDECCYVDLGFFKH